MGKVYSYLRFSSKKQEYGDSKNRQATKALEYCRKHGLTLETTTYEDLGVSAWKGKNFTEGALGAFMKAVDEGKVPRGSTLLVEHLDRVSREKPSKAQELFISIINRGITLVTLNDDISYSEESINGDVSKLLMAVLKLAGANEENEKRSDRTKTGLRASLEKGMKSRRCPAWLTTSADRKSFIVLEDRAAVVQRIFKMCVSGYGIYQIANTLNDEGVPTFNKSRKTGEDMAWKGSHIARMLHDRSVLGHQNARTAGVIRENYYPQIIESKLFYDAEQAMERRNRVGKGRPTNDYLHNLFAGLLRCECGDTIRFIKHKTRPHMRCEGALNGSGCEALWHPYKPLEDEVLAKLLWDADELLIAEAQEAATDETPELRDQIERRKKQRQRLLDFVMEGDMESDEDVQLKLKALRAEIADLEEKLRRAEAMLHAQPEDAAEINNALFFEHYEAHMQQAAPEVIHDIRTRMREAIRRSIARVTLMHGQYFQREGDDENGREIGPPYQKVLLTFHKRSEPLELAYKASTK